MISLVPLTIFINKSMSNIIFLPSEIASMDLSVIYLKCLETDGKAHTVVKGTFVFPCPAGLQYSHTANLGEFDRNVLADKVGKATDMLNKGSSVLTGDVGTKTAFAGTAAVFKGNAARKFNFSFTFYPTSRDEAQKIKNVANYFSQSLYGSLDKPIDDFVNSNTSGGGGGFKGLKSQTEISQNFPPKWEISFYTRRGATLTKNTYIPGITKCFLASVQLNFNANSSSFMEDGAPSSLELQLSFDEDRVLTREDIISLEEGSEINDISAIDPFPVTAKKISQFTKTGSTIGGSVSDIGSIINSTIQGLFKR
jgi:hypothetical protein